MQIGRAQIQITVICMVVVTMIVPVMASMCMAVMTALQEPGTHQIHHQTQGCNTDGLFILSGSRWQQAFHRLHDHDAATNNKKMALV